MTNYHKLSMIGIDLGKNCFHLYGVDRRGNKIFQRKLVRDKLLGFLDEFPRHVIIAFEACGGSHFLARELTKRGFEARIMAPQFVKPYVKSNKNDFIDAEAICEAASRPNMRFVGVKSIEKQEIQMLHRVRARGMKERTAVVNEIRGFLLELGIIFPKGISNARKGIPTLFCDERLSSFMKQLLRELYEELQLCDKRIKALDKQFKQLVKEHPVCSKLIKMKGVGPLTATALYASTTPEIFKNAREFGASLGLVPKQDTTGGKPKLLGISKRGDKYLRQLMVHGARAVVRVAHKDNSKYGAWVQQLKERKNFKKASVAVANKNARIAWVILTQEEDFNPNYENAHYKKAA